MQEAERLGYDSVWTAEAYGSDAATILAWLAQATTRDQARLGDLPDARPLGRDDRDDGRDARPALRRADAARASARAGPQVAEGWHGQRFGKQLQRTREYVAVVRDGARARARRVQGRDARAAAARRARQGAEAHDRAGAGADPDLPGRDRAEEHDAGAARSPTAGSRRCSRPSTSASSARCSRRASRAPAAARASTTSTSRPTVNVFVTDDLDAARDAMRPLHRALRRRHGLAQAELLQPARPALRLRGRRARGPGPLPRGQAARRRWRRCPASCIDTVSLCGPPDVVRERLAVYRDAGVGTLMVSPHGVDARRPAASSCGSWPSWPPSR